MTTPTIGRIVHYTLRAQDAEAINRRRQHARDHLATHQENATGVQVHVGNSVAEGEVYPLLITRVWPGDPATDPHAGSINGQVMLDGNDLFWATSIHCGEGPGTFAWPPRV